MKTDLKDLIRGTPNDVWEEFAAMQERLDKIHTLIRLQDKRIHKIETKEHRE